MNSSGDDRNDDKVVINTMELEFTTPARARREAVSASEAAVLARGTRQQLPLTRPSEASPEDAPREATDSRKRKERKESDAAAAARQSGESRASEDSRGARPSPPSPPSPPSRPSPPSPPSPPSRELRDGRPPRAAPQASDPKGPVIGERTRDPLEVLRTWPHSNGMFADATAPTRATLPAPSGKRVFEDKIMLAHLALELFREVDELHEVTRDVRPGRPEAVPPCGNPSCAARTSALRGAVVEACLLVQRAVLMTPPSASKTEIEASVRGLLGRIER